MIYFTLVMLLPAIYYNYNILILLLKPFYIINTNDNDNQHHVDVYSRCKANELPHAMHTLLINQGYTV
jgi:hypothetical protein